MLFHDGLLGVIGDSGGASLTLALFEELAFLERRVGLGDLELPLLVEKLVAALLDVEHLIGFRCVLRCEEMAVLQRSLVQDLMTLFVSQAAIGFLGSPVTDVLPKPRLLLLIRFHAHLRFSEMLLWLMVLDLDGALIRLIGQNILHQVLDLGVVSRDARIRVHAEGQIFVNFLVILGALSII